MDAAAFPRLRFRLTLIVSLAIWVDKHTSLVIRNQEDFEPLIEVNRMVMQGLAGQGSQAAA